MRRVNDRRPPVPATSLEQVRGQAASAATLAQLDAAISQCRACPRLVAWREHVAAAGRKSYAGQQYWARPIPGWGDEQARILILGLAPAAHGGNRTGRIFTGDRSGDFLFAALHRAGLASLPTSEHAHDGQRLLGVRMVAALRCAPPGNKPTPGERDTCAPWLHAELNLLREHVQVVLALGAFAWAAGLQVLAGQGYVIPRPRPRFAHAAQVQVQPQPGSGRHPVTLLASYHPSQQNTFTGTLTPAMLDEVLTTAKGLV